MRPIVHSALLLLALAGGLQAQFNGMAAQTYGIPEDIWDAAGGTATSASYDGNFSMPGNFGAPAARYISDGAATGNFRIYPDFFFRIPTQTPTASPTVTLSSTPSATLTFTLSDTPSATPTDTLTFTRTSTPSATPTDTLTFTLSDTPSATPSDTPTDTPTFTLSDTPSDTPSATPTATLTQTPYPIITLFKSAGGQTVVNYPGSITYTLSWFNTGSYDADNVVISDTISSGQTYSSSSPAPSGHSGQTYFWNIGTVDANGNGSLTLSVNETASEQSASNQFSASGTDFGTVNSNTVNIGYGTAFTLTNSPTETSSASPTPTDTPSYTLSSTQTDTLTSTETSTITVSPTDTPTFTYSASPTGTPTASFSASPTSTWTLSSTPSDTPTETSTSSASPTATATPTSSSTVSPTDTPTITLTATASASPTVTPTPTYTFAYQTPDLNISMTYTGNPWPGSGFLTYSITFSNDSCAACAAPTDLVLTFNSDTQHSGTGADNELNADAQTCLSYDECTGPEDPMNPNDWSPSNNSNSILATGDFTLAPGAPAINRSAFAVVESNYLNQTITSQAVLSSTMWLTSVTATVNIYISAVEPVTLPPTPTPIAFEGYTAAYPQPAGDHICIAYFAPQGGPLTIDVFNVAFKRVAVITDQSQGGHMETACVGISRLAPGIYFYRAKVGDFTFPLDKFGVLR